MKNQNRKLSFVLMTLLVFALCLGTALADEGTLNLPEEMKVIGPQAFYGLENVTRVILPDGTESVGDGAFGGSGSLQVVEVNPRLVAPGDPGTISEMEARILPGSPNAHIVVREDFSMFEYREEDGHIVITKYLDETSAECRIPARISGLPVTEIGSSAFYSNNALEKVVIPEGVTVIGDYAFGYCYYLSDVTFPSTLASVGQYAFYRCGYSVSGDWAFILPDNIMYMDDWYFPFDGRVIECRAGSVTMNTLLELGESFCLDGNHALRYGRGYLDGEYALFLNSFTGDKTALTGVVIPEGVVGIGSNVFEKCINLRDITLPESLRSIGYKSFAECGTSPEEPFFLHIPDGVAKIDDSAFYWSNNVVFECNPDTPAARIVSEMGSNHDKVFTVAGFHDFRFKYVNHREPTEAEPYHDELRLTLLDYLGEEGHVTVPDFTEVLSNAFSNYGTHRNENTTLKTVTLPADLLDFDSGAFRNCRALESIVIPPRIRKIQDSVFSGCEKLKDVTLPDTVKEIGWSTFKDCASAVEETVYYVLPDHLSGYSWKPFDGCKAVLVTNKDSETAVWLSGEASVNYSSMEGDRYSFTAPGEYDFRYQYVAYTEDGEKKLHLNLVKYAGAGAEAVIPEGPEYIDKTAFTGNETITRVVIPEGVTRIFDGAFRNCYSLTDITFPSSLKVLDQNVFNYCGRDAEEAFYFILPDQMESMVGRGGGAQTFSDCNAILQTGKYSRTAELLTDKNFCYTVAGERDFRYRYLSYTEGGETGRRLWLVGYAGAGGEVSVPRGIYGVRRYQWDPPYGTYEPGPAYNQTIRKLILPEGTTVIEDSAFIGCVNLTDITFPESLKVLKNHAFEQCGKNSEEIHYFVLPDEMEEISTNTAAGWGAFTDINKGRLVCSPDSETAKLVSEVYSNHNNGYYHFAIRGHETDGLLYRWEQRKDANGETVYRLILRVYEGTDPEVVIPSGCGIYGINNDVFQNRSSLQKVSLPSGIVEIRDGAFKGCTLLHQSETVKVNEEDQYVIRLPDTLQRIDGGAAFSGVGSGYTAQRFYMILPSSLTEFDVDQFRTVGAVLVAPVGSMAAGKLHGAYFYYYLTLEDAVKRINCQSRVDYDSEGNVIPHDHYGKP